MGGRAAHVLGEEHLVTVVPEHVMEVLARAPELPRGIPEERDRLVGDGLGGVSETPAGLAHVVQAFGIARGVDMGRPSDRPAGLALEEAGEHRPRRLGGRRHHGCVGEESGEGGTTLGRARHPLQFDEPRVREPVRFDLVIDESRSEEVEAGGVGGAVLRRLMQRRLGHLHAHLEVAHDTELGAQYPVPAPERLGNRRIEERRDLGLA